MTPPVLSILRDLVALPSVNPMGRPVPQAPPYFEGRVTDYLERFFRELGVPCERIPIAPGRDNLIARHEPPRARRTLLWDAHQDTVPVEGMTVAPFDPVVECGRLFGRGSCDVKGGLAAMLAAFARLVRDRPRDSARVILACTVDEEYTHTGSSALAAMGLDVDLAIVAEPTMLQVVTAHKGAVRWKVVTEGVACHSSSPSRGVNAIYRMGRLLTVLEPYADRLANGPDDPILGPPSLSVGRIEGGQSVNIVPDSCRIELDRRVIPGETVDGVRDDLHRALTEGLSGAFPFTFEEPWVRMPSLSPSSSRGWVGSVLESVSNVLGRPSEVSSVPYGTDAGPLAAAGIPSIVLGPGDIAQAHTEDEWIEIAQLEQAVDIYEAIARDLEHVDPD